MCKSHVTDRIYPKKKKKKGLKEGQCVYREENKGHGDLK